MKLDREFWKKLRSLVFPIAFQQVMLALVSATDAVMLGMLSQDAMSAVSLAGQVQFVFSLYLATMTIGTSMFAAQYWGKRDVDTVERFKLLGEIFGKPCNSWVEPPFYFCYGRHISVGSGCYINVNCNFIDDGRITIGNRVMFGPSVTPLTPTCGGICTAPTSPSATTAGLGPTASSAPASPSERTASSAPGASSPVTFPPTRSPPETPARSSGRLTSRT